MADNILHPDFQAMPYWWEAYKPVTGDLTDVDLIFSPTYIDHQRPSIIATQGSEEFRQVVLLARNIGRHFLPVRKPYAGDLAKCGIGLLRGHGLDLKTYATLLRRSFQVLDLINAAEGSAGFFDELVDGWHSVFSVVFLQERFAQRTL